MTGSTDTIYAIPGGRNRRPLEKQHMTTEIEPLPDEGLHLDGVILPGDIDRGARALVGLTLVFTPAGIEIRSPEPDADTFLSWAGMDSARCSERVILADLQSAAVLECVSNGRTIRILLPVETVAPGQVAYLELAVPHWLTLYKEAGYAPAGSATPLTDLPAPHPGAGDVVPAGAAAFVGASTWPEGVPATVPPPRPSSSVGPTNWSPPTSDDGWSPSLPPEEWLPVEEPEPVWTLAPAPAPAFQPVNGNGNGGPHRSDGPPVLPPPLASFVPIPPDGVGNPWADLAGAGSPETNGAPSTNGSSADEPAEESAPRDRRSARRKRRTRTLLVVLGVAVIAVIAILLLTRSKGGTPNAASDVALAGSINLRASDLPASWVRSTSTAAVPPLATPSKLVAAEGTLATCLGQPLAAVQGWFGADAFPGLVTQVRSPTFGNVTVPTVQMYSNTSVLGTSAQTQSLLPAVASPKFTSCFGQYQVSAVALPATAQVQAVPLTAPAGAKAYGYVTTFTIPGVGNEVVGDAFIIGDRVVTLLKASTSGPSIPSAEFNQAFQAVAGRVARANGS